MPTFWRTAGKMRLRHLHGKTWTDCTASGWLVFQKTGETFCGSQEVKRAKNFKRKLELAIQSVALAWSFSQNSFNKSHSFVKSLKIWDHRFLKTCPA
jgi:hypothetical protein